MKTLRVIIFLAVVSLFTTSHFNAAEARDCSNPKGFHEKMMCKISGSSSSSESSEKEKSGDSFWQKIKNFGGKNVGEAG